MILCSCIRLVFVNYLFDRSIFLFRGVDGRKKKIKIFGFYIQFVAFIVTIVTCSTVRSKGIKQ